MVERGEQIKVIYSMCRRQGSSKKAREMSQQLGALSLLLFPSPHCGLNNVLWTQYMVPNPGRLSPLFFLQSFPITTSFHSTYVTE